MSFEVEQVVESHASGGNQESVLGRLWDDIWGVGKTTGAGGTDGQAQQSVAHLEKQVRTAPTQKDNESPASNSPSSNKSDSWTSETVPAREIKLLTEPAVYMVAQGDSLTKIARDHLGAGATEKEVQEHTGEIVRANGLKDANTIYAKKALMLPGRTADGGVVSDYGFDEKYIVWKDGSEAITRDDGSGFFKAPDSHGGYSVSSHGDSPEENHVLMRSAESAI